MGNREGRGEESLPLIVMHPATYHRMKREEKEVGITVDHLCDHHPPGAISRLRQELVDPMAIGFCSICGEAIGNVPSDDPSDPRGE
jgi:hypothetical protein